MSLDAPVLPEMLARMRPGGVGATLDVPRTATVTATEPLVLRTLAREPFLAAVTGNQLSGDDLALSPRGRLQSLPDR